MSIATDCLAGHEAAMTDWDNKERKRLEEENAEKQERARVESAELREEARNTLGAGGEQAEEIAAFKNDQADYKLKKAGIFEAEEVKVIQRTGNVTATERACWVIDSYNIEVLLKNCPDLVIKTLDETAVKEMLKNGITPPSVKAHVEKRKMYL